jgi:hypothetical protein
MWFAVLFVCVTGGCDFVFSPPLNSQQDCQRIVQYASKQMDADKDVTAYKFTCFQVKQT